MFKVGYASVYQYAWRLYRQNFKQLFVIAFVVIALATLVSMPVESHFADESTQMNLGLSIAVLLLMQALLVFGHGMQQVLLAYSQANQLPKTYQELARPVFLRFWILLSGALLMNSLLLLGAFLYVVPCILILSLSLIYLPLILFERCQLWAAFQTSFKRSFSQGFRPIVIAMTILLVLFVPPLLGQWASQFLTVLLPGPLAFAFDKIWIIVLTALGLSWVNALVFSFYVNLRLVDNQSQLLDLVKKLKKPEKVD